MCLLFLFFLCLPFVPADSYLKAKASLKKHSFAQRIARMARIDSPHPVSARKEWGGGGQLTLVV